MTLKQVHESTFNIRLHTILSEANRALVWFDAITDGEEITYVQLQAECEAASRQLDILVEDDDFADPQARNDFITLLRRLESALAALGLSFQRRELSKLVEDVESGASGNRAD